MIVVQIMKVAFQMEPMEESDKERTNALLMMQEACERGYEVFHYLPETLVLSNNGVKAKIAPVTVNLQEKKFYQLGEYHNTDLRKMNIIFMRNHPPFDTKYLTWTYILEELVKLGVYVTNDPVTIRNFSEKFSIFDLKQHLPATIVTRCLNEAKEFLQTYKNIIVKPLYYYSSKGVIKTRSIDEISLQFEKYPEALMFQQFIPEISKGKTRVLLFDSEVHGAITRIPEEGDFLTPLDSQDLLHNLTDEEMKVCKDVAKITKKYDLDLVGLDLIGTKVIEINVTCVGGMLELNKVTNDHCEKPFWDMIERKYKTFKR